MVKQKATECRYVGSGRIAGIWLHYTYTVGMHNVIGEGKGGGDLVDDDMAKRGSGTKGDTRP